MNTLLAVCCSSVGIAYIECLISEFTKENIFVVELDIKYFATAHLFIINMISVLEETIR